MKRRTSVVLGLVLVCMVWGSVVVGQVPTLTLYEDSRLIERYFDCPCVPAGMVVDTLFVVADGFNAAIASIEFMVDIAHPLLYFLADVVPMGIVEGVSVEGIRVTYPGGIDATGRVVVDKIHFVYFCDCCPYAIWDTPLQVLPHPESGKIQAYRWPDMVPIEAEGMTSLLCITAVPVQESTWGKIKALFD